MSFIRELIAQLEREDEQRRKDDEKHFADQTKKYEEMQKKLDCLKDESKKHTDNVIKSLDHLVANQHSIEKALKQTENLTGLSIPLEQHETAIDLISKASVFINNVEIIDNPNIILPGEVQQEVISATESVVSDLKVCHNEVVQMQALYHNTICLKSLLDNSNDEETEDLNGSIFDTLVEN